MAGPAFLYYSLLKFYMGKTSLKVKLTGYERGYGEKEGEEAG